MQPWRPGGRLLGLSLLIMWAVMLSLSVFQQITYSRRLAKKVGSRPQIPIALASSVAMLVIGIMALINVIFRVGPF